MDKINIKKKLLKIVTTIWMVIVPFILGLGFALGCFMCMWKIWMWPLWLCILISVIITGGCVFAVGKMIGKW